eukprot:Platyproteum_vivax@DN4570_c0_g1_i1.p1
MGEWNHGLLGCCANPCKTVIASFVPCITMGNIAKEMDMDFCTFCWCGNPVTIRAMVRGRDNIPGGCCNDCLVGCCCWCCSLVQCHDQAAYGPGKAPPGQMEMS